MCERVNNMNLQIGCRLLLLGLVSVIAAAQASSNEEIVVTAMKRSAAGQSLPALPAVTIRKRADFLLQSVELTNDTRDAAGRQEELHQTLRGLATAAAKTPALSLAWQSGFLIPITEKDYRIDLAESGDREDTNSATIFIKYALTPTTDVNAAIRTLNEFVRGAKMVGRSKLEPSGEMALSVVNPERYRGEVIAALAATVRDLRASFGPTCKIAISDFSQRLQWQRSDVSELTLYLPYDLKVEGC